MIKKILHYICAIAGCILWTALLVLIIQQIFAYIYGLNLFEKRTYSVLSHFWNSGGVLHAKEIVLLLLTVLCLPLCIYGWKKLWNYKYIQLLTGPLNKLFNSGLEGYRPPDVNIKNLKIEEKKTIEQIVKERLDIEKKKQGQMEKTDIRKDIRDKIEESKNKSDL